MSSSPSSLSLFYSNKVSWCLPVNFRLQPLKGEGVWNFDFGLKFFPSMACFVAFCWRQQLWDQKLAVDCIQNPYWACEILETLKYLTVFSELYYSCRFFKKYICFNSSSRIHCFLSLAFPAHPPKPKQHEFSFLCTHSSLCHCTLPLPYHRKTDIL